MSQSPANDPAVVTVHLILQAHLDPIWLWPWTAGLDSALATCRSACDRLDAHPDLIFTRGEAWVYWQIEQVDRPLFERMRRHIAAGRWEIVGGWWIQPDCNLPSADGMRRQIDLGKHYFTERFNQFPRIAYNVDSFGHAAALPTLMRQAGQDGYVMMRPQDHERALPARLFRWRERAGAPEVTTFRIAGAYNSPSTPTIEHVQQSLRHLPAGIRHTMCFVGLGDHGGGPTERTIAWCRAHRDAIPGCRLEFSSPRRFFEAIGDQVDSLPLVTGELQHHAVGCYSVYRPIKNAVARGERLLGQAAVAAAHDPAPPANVQMRLDEAWRDVCFNQFHDTLGGTCIASAYEMIHAQLGRAAATADEIIQHSLRRRLAALPDDPMQRLVFFNASDKPFDDFVEAEPWLEWAAWQPHWRWRDERGRVIPCQPMHSEALTQNLTRLLLRLAAKPGECRVLRLDRSASPSSRKPSKAALAAKPGWIESRRFAAVRLGRGGHLILGGRKLALPRLELLEDETDTWSHHIDRYPAKALATATFERPEIVDQGPLMASLIQRGKIGDSPLRIEYRVYAGEPFVDLLLRVHWLERFKVLKLTVPFPAEALRRWDGVMGGELQRPMEGKEVPVAGHTRLKLADGMSLGVVCPEIYALDCTPRRLRLTLLRSPLMAHHFPHPPEGARGTVADQGEHFFRLRFYGGRSVSARLLQAAALAAGCPTVMADLTRGMPAV